MKMPENKISIILILLFAFGSTSVWADLNRSKVKAGVKAFDESQYDKSLQHFQDALLDDPENPLGHYNVAEALYKNKKYEEAIKSYQKSLNSEDITLREKAFYNLGNSYYQMNKYQEAIQNYIKALELDPNDQDAKHNLELVRAKLKEMADKQPMQNQQQNQQNQQGGQQDQQQQNQQQDQQQAQQQQQQQQGDQDKEQQNQQEQQEQQQDLAKQDEQQKQQGEEKQAQQIDKKKELSKEEAERILQALRSDEKENQKLRRPEQTARRPRVEKDW
jgi:Ca-activated chloride channel family protein